VRFAGAIPYDTTLVQCVKGRKAYLAEYPRTRTAEMLRAVAESVLSPRTASPGAFPGPWVAGAEAYRVLGIRPGAPQDEILDSYVRLRRALRSDSPALAPLDCELERRATAAEVESAYRTLSRNLSCTAPDPSRPPIPSNARRFRRAFPGASSGACPRAERRRDAGLGPAVVARRPFDYHPPHF